VLVEEKEGRRWDRCRRRWNRTGCEGSRRRRREE
jgi:hypothetical protein